MKKSGLGTLRRDFSRNHPYAIESATGDCFFNSAQTCFSPYCRLVSSHPDGYEKCVAHRRLALKTAVETGQKNIVLCHAGLITCVYPAMRNGQVHGAYFMGKVRIRSEYETGSDPMPAGTAPWVKRAVLERAWAHTRIVTPPEFREASQNFVDLVKKHIPTESGSLEAKYLADRQQSEIAEVIHREKNAQKAASYSYPLERELVSRVSAGDREGAHHLLNKILGNILLAHAGNTALIKARVLELLVVLSRSGVEGARDAQEIFEINQAHSALVVAAESPTQVCLHGGQALDHFLNLAVRDQSGQRHESLRKALSHIEAHYEEKLTLAIVAQAVNLSPWRLAHLFRERLDTTFGDQVSRVRVEHARELLISSAFSATEVAYRAGFSDQSYFTKVFKKVVGLTPKRFQLENRRLKNYYTSAPPAGRAPAGLSERREGSRGREKAGFGAAKGRV